MQLAPLTLSGGVAILTLHRPEAHNALSIELLAALHQALDVAATTATKVLILRGAGKSFCAGMDLKAVLNEPGAPARLLQSLAELTVKLRALPQVTIARVHGAAIGGGCGLTCVCDLALTHADSKVGYPEVDLGVCPAVVAPWLIRKIGAGKARRVLLMGGLLTGQQAYELGMIDAVCGHADELDGLVAEYVERLGKGGANALAVTKGYLNTLDGSLEIETVMRGADISAKVLELPETRALLTAKMSGDAKKVK